MSEQVKYKIEKQLGILSVNKQKGWKKEINIINWNDIGNKLDIRDWSDDHKKMSKGITLYKDEIQKLKEILSTENLDTIKPMPNNTHPKTQ